MNLETFHKINRAFYWIGIAYIFIVLLGVMFFELPPELDPFMPFLFFGGIYFFVGVGFILPGIGGLKYGVLTVRWFLASPLTVLAAPEKVRGKKSVLAGSAIAILIGIGVLLMGGYFLTTVLSNEGHQSKLAIQEQLCREEAQEKLDELGNAIDLAAEGAKRMQTVYFTLNYCSPEDESLSVSSATGLLGYNYYGKQVLDSFIEYDRFSFKTMLSVSRETVFPYMHNGTVLPPSTELKCQEKDGYILNGFKTTDPQGEYLIVNETDTQDSTPTICVYKKV